MFPLHDDNPTRRPAVINWAIIVVNIAVFIYMLSLPPDKRQLFVIEHGFIPARMKQLATHQPLLVQFPMEMVSRRTGAHVVVEEQVRIPADSRGIIESLFTAMFIHGGWVHIIGNLWFLAIFGNNVEDRLGRFLYPLFYLAGGLLASAGQWAQNPGNTTPMVGASGAIAAVLGAYAVTWPRARVYTLIFLGIFFTTVYLPALVVLGFWFVAQIISARSDLGGGQGVAFMAHVAGFAAGAALMLMLREVIAEPPDEPPAPHDVGFEYV